MVTTTLWQQIIAAESSYLVDSYTETNKYPVEQSFFFFNVTVLDRNQAEQGGTGGSSPQFFGSDPQDWFLVIGSSYFTTSRSGPIDAS
jgi:hypothetical protein